MPGSSSPHAESNVTDFIAQAITSKLGRRHDQRSDQPVDPRRGRFRSLSAAARCRFRQGREPRFKSQPIERIAIAGAFVVAGYVTLTFYDFFALHTIGRHKVPYAVAALASFTSFTIGHSLGAAVLTGGLIRLRIYSVWGLTVVDIAKIAFVTGMTFWLGNAFLLGGATVYAPEAATVVDHLPSSINRAIGLSGLVAIGCYLLWLAPRSRDDRPRRLADRSAQPALHARADRHRRAGPHFGYTGDVYAVAGAAPQSAFRRYWSSSSPRRFLGRSATRPAASASSKRRCSSDFRNFSARNSWRRC